MKHSSDFRKKTAAILLLKGFKKKGSVFFHEGSILHTLISLQKSSNSDTYYVNVGLCIKDLAEDIPAKSELSHCHFRLERIFPEFREEILTAGDTSATDNSLTHDYYRLLNERLLPELLAVTSDKNRLLTAYRSGRFENGLLRPAARDFFQSFS